MISINHNFHFESKISHRVCSSVLRRRNFQGLKAWTSSTKSFLTINTNVSKGSLPISLFILKLCLLCFLMRYTYTYTFSSVQSLSCVLLFATPWTAACQASLTITNSRSLLKLMSIESVMPSSHLILCRPLLLLPPIPPSIRVFSNESTLCMRWPKYWSFSLASFLRCSLFNPNS